MNEPKFPAQHSPKGGFLIPLNIFDADQRWYRPHTFRISSGVGKNSPSPGKASDHLTTSMDNPFVFHSLLWHSRCHFRSGTSWEPKKYAETTSDN